jgi:DNA-binding MarR family transcriptional regulator
VTEADETAAEIVDRMNRLLGEMWEHNTRRWAEAGLSMPEAKALLHLDLDQTMSMRELAAATHASPSNITVTVDRLQARGLVGREDAKDRRVRGVRLTQAGMGLRQELQKRIVDDHPSLRGLDEADRTTLLSILRRIG